MVTRKVLHETVIEFHNRSKKDEELIMEATEKSFGGKCYMATEKEDMFKHVDFWWESPKMGKIGIDAKGLKKNKRTDAEYDDTIHWLELRNVLGKPGWLYGEATYIAFLTKTHIIYVRRDKLAAFAEKAIEGKSVVSSTPKDFYIPYKRFKRNDLLLKVPTSDLYNLCDFVLEL